MQDARCQMPESARQRDLVFSRFIYNFGNRFVIPKHLNIALLLPAISASIFIGPELGFNAGIRYLGSGI